ncbi:UNVERIFIED_CONTAM: Retrovirus-related Pol polyprotein from transposon TNT 1-94 [Sesamum radiatum]|uniref:Retrovirus-related Pol polyprotein from transposon TNT 1-94 n=1 Tax=Sesamum radiatum TaxID=300843 RepID=A0AAW2TUS3_SESRA
MEAGESVHMATQGKNKDQAKGKRKAKVPPHAEIKKESKCFFCKKEGHIKKDCPKFKIWLEKKVSRLVSYGYSFKFGDDITLFYNNHFVGNGTLSNGLYHINLQSDALYTLHVYANAGIKRCVMNEDSCVLWHRRLGHISIERIKKLVNDGVLNTLDFTDFDTYVGCIKGKQTNVSKKGFKAEVEKQCDKRIKVVRSDRGGEYFGRYTEGGQAPGPFAKFLAEQECPSEVRVYNPQEKKLDPRTISGYFVGYAESLRDTDFIVHQEDDLISGSDKGLSIRSNVDHSESQLSTSSNGLIVVVYNTPTVQMRVEQPIQTVPQVDDHEPVDPVVPHIPRNVEQPVDQQAPPENVDATLRRSTRIKRSAISSDYMVYLQESEFNVGAENDPETSSQAMKSRESNLWYDAMKEEMNSMAFNEVWDLVKLPDGFKAIRCKWVFKTKKDSLGNIKRHKAKLVAMGFTQREGIDYTETFSPVSKKESLRTIMALVAHFDMDLHQMDVKTFLNGELEEEVYMKQLEGFSSSNGEHLNFEMEDMGEASYVIGIKIHRDRSQCILGLSQETYINKILERFRMKDCSPSIAPIVKGDKLHLNQCPRNDLEREQMKDIPYASAI